MLCAIGMATVTVWCFIQIPIVKLNPFNILNVKLAGEVALRKSGVSTSINSAVLYCY
jgi:hypothetical protein